MEIIYANEQTFNEDVKEELVLVDFFANWCGPCKMLGPILENLSQTKEDVKIVKVDIDENESLAKTYGVMSIPTMILFKNGQEVAKNVGFMPEEEIINFIDSNK